MEPTKQYCHNCQGTGLVVEAARDGYHLYRQCPDCKGRGYQLQVKR